MDPGGKCFGGISPCYDLLQLETRGTLGLCNCKFDLSNFMVLGFYLLSGIQWVCSFI